MMHCGVPDPFLIQIRGGGSFWARQVSPLFDVLVCNVTIAATVRTSLFGAECLAYLLIAQENVCSVHIHMGSDEWGGPWCTKPSHKAVVEHQLGSSQPQRNRAGYQHYYSFSLIVEHPGGGPLAR